MKRFYPYKSMHEVAGSKRSASEPGVRAGMIIYTNLIRIIQKIVCFTEANMEQVEEVQTSSGKNFTRRNLVCVGKKESFV